ncbi:hypothetical protein [Ohtaekwangia koreensis]|uniref:DUF4440 domain-containing protein n=1 Tax=Ohtaekwangia koreensis TaxID=688867 RepID=A0A1T5J5Y7_9BACT|nr:hypothetical protein [Ohtaekwangia koreensis]SKC46794.1 hypothetical protein SAMN05660236_0787 [Ohtaekwangia koreensis]
MRKIIVVFAFLAITNTLFGQIINISFAANPEHLEFQKEIALIESVECKAFYKMDTIALQRIWTTAIIQPEFYRSIAHVSREIKMIWMASDGSVYATGQEVLTPINGSNLASLHTIGYTHQWQKQFGSWRLIARHMHPLDSER